MNNKAIDLEVSRTLSKFYGEKGAKDAMEKAAGALVFPSIYKAGLFGFGGSYGDGALIVKDQTKDYYNLVSASFGFQLGIQSYSLIMLFLTQAALDQFVNSQGWQVGVNASVAVLDLGTGGTINTDSIKESVVAIAFDNTGLMYSLSLEGTKITKI